MTSKLMIKSTTFFKIIIENISEEDDIVLLDTLLPTFAGCASCYIPDYWYSEVCTLMFRKIYEKMISLPPKKEALKSVLKSELFTYLYNEEHVEFTAKWLENKCVVEKNGTVRTDLPLKTTDRYAILKKVYQSPKIPLEFKQTMLQREIELNNNDRSQRLSHECDASLPDLTNKARVWDIISQPTQHDISYYDYGAYIEGFF